MRPALRALVAGGLGFAVSLIAACGGGSRVLSADQANALSQRLNQLQAAVNRGDCGGVLNGLSGLSTEITNVPNATARANLTEGFDTLQRQATSECPASTPHTTSTTTTTKTTTTQSTPTVSTQAQTIPTTTATTPANTGTTTNPGPGSGGAGLAPGNSGGAPGHNKPIGNGY
jgi:hypothetical protein